MIRKLIRNILKENKPKWWSENRVLVEQEEFRMPFELSVPNDIWEIKRFFDGAGKKLFIVGGAIRDAYMGKAIKDYDLATDATPQEISQILPQASKQELKSNDGKPPRGKYVFIEAGNIFPVVHLVTSQGNRYEIATFREDVSSNEVGGHRKPETKISTIDQDVKRRDLTVNALFYDLDTKEIVDLVGGIRDIENYRVRTVGDPTARFAENEIRKLRALRFAARMGSELDDEIKESLRKHPSLSTEAPEAIQAEFLKGLKQALSVRYYMEMLFEYNLHKWVFKDLEVDRSFIVEERDPTLLVASIARNSNPKTLRDDLKQRLKYSDDFAKRVTFFVMFQNFAPDKIMVFHKLNTSIVRISERDLMRASDIFGYDKQMVSAFFKFEPIANAQDLMLKGFQGQTLGKEMDRINIEHFKSLI